MIATLFLALALNGPLHLPSGSQGKIYNGPIGSGTEVGRWNAGRQTFQIRIGILTQTYHISPYDNYYYAGKHLWRIPQYYGNRFCFSHNAASGKYTWVHEKLNATTGQYESHDITKPVFVPYSAFGFLEEGE